ncbi:molybdenum cofactor guanylyltransferase [Aquimarina sp. M1]
MQNKKQDITGIILAGGKSSRMGQDKGLKLHNGQPFIQHVITAMQTSTDKILIITGSTDYEMFGYPCIPDSIPDQGPVGGIYTGLKHTDTAHNLILSCDVPFVTTAVLNNLIAEYESGYDVIAYEQVPLVALYNKSVQSNFLESIEKKRLSLRKTLSTLTVKSIPIKKNIKHYIKNINTPQQYKEAIQ